MDAQYDAACADVSSCELALQRYLVDFKRDCDNGGKGVSMISLNKDSHILEVPESLKVWYKHRCESLTRQKKRNQRCRDKVLNRSTN